MLSILEQEIVNTHKEWYFGGYLQWAWMTYPDLQAQLIKGEFPEKEVLLLANKRMNEKKVGFDCQYTHSLSHIVPNPLQIETDAWKLLSPRIQQYGDEFENYIEEKYSPKISEQERLLNYISYGWNLLQQWNVISNSYKAKYSKSWTKVEEREQAVKKLILSLK